MKQQSADFNIDSGDEVGSGLGAYFWMSHLYLSGSLISPRIPSLKFLASNTFCIANFKLLVALGAWESCMANHFLNEIERRWDFISVENQNGLIRWKLTSLSSLKSVPVITRATTVVSASISAFQVRELTNQQKEFTICAVVEQFGSAKRTQLSSIDCIEGEYKSISFRRIYRKRIRTRTRTRTRNYSTRNRCCHVMLPVVLD